MSGEWGEDRRARVALGSVCEAASPALAQLLSTFTASEVWQMVAVGKGPQAWTTRASALDVDRLIDRSLQLGLRFIVPGDAEWPAQLADLDAVAVNDMTGAPAGLWLQGPGNLRDLSCRSVAIVGSRACTAYGNDVGMDLAAELARPGAEDGGWTVISGGAYGIDAAAHRAAQAAGGSTIAIMAGGLDELYPKGNSELLERIRARHLLVSELAIGMPPSRRGFLARNRLIAALAGGTIIVEGAPRSGAHNTINWSSQLGRIAMAVPGPVGSAMSVTPHRLIRDQRATLVADAADVRSLLSPIGAGPELPIGGSARHLDGLSEDAFRVREVLPRRGSISLDDVCLRAGLRPMRAAASLVSLRAEGLAAQTPDGCWRLTRP